jgi:hypothetical protein
MPKALRVIKVQSGGLSLYWPDLDESLWLPDLLRGITGTRAWMASHVGAAAGASIVQAKREAARQSRLLGRRPPKN